MAIIEDSEKSILALDSDGTLLYQLKAQKNAGDSFSSAKFIALDETYNLYALDARFGGAFERNVERVLKYSDEGKFLAEIYRYEYVNEDFITTKGRIAGMVYSDGAVHLVRMDNEGFYVDRVDVAGRMDGVESVFFPYPNAFRDLVFFNLNIERKKIAVTTKSGGVKQYDFSGKLLYEAAAESTRLPWTVASDENDNLIYTDILNNEIVFINVSTYEQRTLFTAPSGESPYYRIAHGESGGNSFLAASYDNIVIMNETGKTEIINSYSFSSTDRRLFVLLFLHLTLDILAFVVSAVSAAVLLFKKNKDSTFKRIIWAAFCITFGAVLASILIINEMNVRYYERIYSNLENISRLTAINLDTDIVTSLSQPSDYENEAYAALKNSLKENFSHLSFAGQNVYQTIWMERDGVVYMMWDLESSVGVFYPFEEYEGSTYQQTCDSRQYVYSTTTTSEGSWLFVDGPIFDKEGNIVAVIETGYDLSTVEAQTKSMVIQTVLIVIASAVAFLLLMIEFILIMNAYKKNKVAIKENERLPFRAELPRAVIFFLFATINLPSAILPVYASNLYKPLFNLPRELVVTFPFIADMGATSIALLVIPNVLGKIGLKQISLLAAIFVAGGYTLCFLAPDTLYLTVAYAFTGFSGGALLLALNAVIGAQKDVKDVNNGFAHFNASFLAGMNVGVVFGSILAQFFSYRIVYLFSSAVALILLVTLAFSMRSKAASYLYEIELAKEEKSEKFALVKFIFKPVVFISLLFLLLPYVVSMSFTSYFMPAYGLEQGLRESNIGQLMLLSGLFAILFGTSLCDYVSQKFPLKVIIVASLLLNAGGVYLFSLNVSIFMLIVVIVILAIANIFVLTNIQTYYATLYQGETVSSMKALSVYSAVENLSMAIGPVIFSYMLDNVAVGMKLLAGALAACIAVFVIASGVSFKTGARRSGD
ncbi:MAG: MFS transporter [Treponema sp.]|nr:MFS transporter [Treponema sp.]